MFIQVRESRFSVVLALRVTADSKLTHLAGTVMQCVASMSISLGFLLLHAYVWPYPHAGANVLKLVTEIQVCGNSLKLKN